MSKDSNIFQLKELCERQSAMIRLLQQQLVESQENLLHSQEAPDEVLAQLRLLFDRIEANTKSVPK